MKNDFIYINEDENYDPVSKPSTSYIINEVGSARVLAFSRVEGTTVAVAIATNDNDSWGVVKGVTETSSKIYIETDGSMSVLGWDALNTLVNSKADRVTSATAGNFAGLDANGNLTDSGVNADDLSTFARKDDLKTITVVDSERLGGKLPSEYRQQVQTAVLNPDFTTLLEYIIELNPQTRRIYDFYFITAIGETLTDTPVSGGFFVELNRPSTSNLYATITSGNNVYSRRINANVTPFTWASSDWRITATRDWITDKTPDYGETFKILRQTVDSKGRTTGIEERNIKLPEKPNIGNGTVTINQGGEIIGEFALNQSDNVEINIEDVQARASVYDTTVKLDGDVGETIQVAVNAIQVPQDEEIILGQTLTADAGWDGVKSGGTIEGK